MKRGARPRIAIGIGAQKSGSSWLHAYLASHPDVYFRHTKELHYFDVLEAGGMQLFREKLLKNRKENPASERAIAIATETDEMLLATRWHRRIFAGPNGIYLRHLMQGRQNQAVVGEVTPAYATCSLQSFQQISKLGPQLRLIYIMRDPVERMWSNVRMLARKSPDGGIGPDESESYFRLFAQGKRRSVSKRCNYARTLEILGKILPPHQFLTGFYEELFTGAGTRQVTDFLEIAAHAGDLETRPNPGQKIELSVANRQLAMQLLRGQYEAVEKFMGRLPQSWHESLREAA